MAYRWQKYWDIADQKLPSSDPMANVPFGMRGLSGDRLQAWQMDHPGQTYFTPDQMASITGGGGGGGGGGFTLASFDPMQSMRRPQKKKKRSENVLGMLAALNGGTMFGQPNASMYGGSPMASIFGSVR